MRAVLALIALLVAAPAVHAQAPPRPLAPEPWALRSPGVPQPVTTPVSVRAEEQRVISADAAVRQDLPQRGSFWWLVGAIVVAGVILAVIL